MKVERRCSFCSKSNLDVAQMLTTIEAAICNECVLLCGEIIVKSNREANKATANFPTGSMGEEVES